MKTFAHCRGISRWPKCKSCGRRSVTTANTPSRDIMADPVTSTVRGRGAPVPAKAAPAGSTPRSVRVAVALAFAWAPLAVSAFDIDLKEPALSLSVPGVQPIELRERPVRLVDQKRTLVGSDAVYTVELELWRQASEPSPRVCAGLMLRSLVAQPGMPDRDSIYRAPLDAHTFLVIYTQGDEPAQKLHAHIISSAGTTHCADAHFSRPATPGEDIDAWRTTFTSARVKPTAP